MKIKIHRGTREIGGSCIEVCSKGSRIILDIGLPLVDSAGDRFNMNNIEQQSGQGLVSAGVLPDMRGCYEWDMDQKKPDGVLISHSHLDHYGLAPYLRKDIRYFMGEGTRRILELNSIFLGYRGIASRCGQLKSGVPVKIGAFTVTPYLMDHSAFDAYAFLVEAQGIKILYSGDFRSHGRKTKAFEWFLQNVPRQIDALLIEGSTIGREGKEIPSERKLEAQLSETTKQTKGALYGLASAQNIDRIVSFFKAARRNNRLFVIDVYLACILDKLKDLARLPHLSETEFKNMRIIYTKHICDSLRRKGHLSLMTQFRQFRISKADIARNPERFVIMVRPSMLTDLNSIGNLKESTLVYSMWSGYLEDPSMQKMFSFAEKRGMAVRQLHTSGHANIETIKNVIDILDPKCVIPIHTFYPESFLKLSERTLLAQDGETIDLKGHLSRHWSH